MVQWSSGNFTFGMGPTGNEPFEYEGAYATPTGEMASAPAHPFYQKLNKLLKGEKFDEFVGERCAKFYAPKFGRPSLTPGI
jgi:hypothetical protein